MVYAYFEHLISVVRKVELFFSICGSSPDTSLTVTIQVFKTFNFVLLSFYNAVSHAHKNI